MIFDRVEVVQANNQPVGSRSQRQQQRQVLADLVNDAPSFTVVVGPDLFQWFGLDPAHFNETTQVYCEWRVILKSG